MVKDYLLKVVTLPQIGWASEHQPVEGLNHDKLESAPLVHTIEEKISGKKTPFVDENNHIFLDLRYNHCHQ